MTKTHRYFRRLLFLGFLCAVFSIPSCKTYQSGTIAGTGTAEQGVKYYILAYQFSPVGAFKEAISRRSYTGVLLAADETVNGNKVQKLRYIEASAEEALAQPEAMGSAVSGSLFGSNFGIASGGIDGFSLPLQGLRGLNLPWEREDTIPVDICVRNKDGEISSGYIFSRYHGDPFGSDSAYFFSMVFRGVPDSYITPTGLPPTEPLNIDFTQTDHATSLDGFTFSSFTMATSTIGSYVAIDDTHCAFTYEVRESLSTHGPHILLRYTLNGSRFFLPRNIGGPN